MPKEVYACWFFYRGFCTDTCAGGSFTFDHETKQPKWDEEAACEYATPQEAEEAMMAAELGKVGVDYEVVPLIRRK